MTTLETDENEYKASVTIEAQDCLVNLGGSLEVKLDYCRLINNRNISFNLIIKVKLYTFFIL